MARSWPGNARASAGIRGHLKGHETGKVSPLARMDSGEGRGAPPPDTHWHGVSTSWPGRTSSAARIDRAAQPGTDRDARRRAWSEREPGPPPRLAPPGARRPTVHAGPRPRRSTGCWPTTSPLLSRCTRSASSQRTVRCGRRRAGRWARGTGSPPSVNGRRARDRVGAGAPGAGESARDGWQRGGWKGMGGAAGGDRAGGGRIPGWLVRGGRTGVGSGSGACKFLLSGSLGGSVLHRSGAGRGP